MPNILGYMIMYRHVYTLVCVCLRVVRSDTGGCSEWMKAMGTFHCTVSVQASVKNNNNNNKTLPFFSSQTVKSEAYLWI